MNYTKKILAATIIAVFAFSIISLAAPSVAATNENNWTVQVLAPTPGQIVTDPVLQLHVIAHGYVLDSRYAGTPNLRHIGHYHEILDGRLIDMTPTTNPTYDTISMVGVTPGPHVLTIIPARNDHSMIMQNAVNVPFTYSGPFLPQPGPFTFNGPASISIVSVIPAVGQGDEHGDFQTDSQGNSFVMTVNVQNFVLSGESFGKDLQTGVGHWHIFVDQPMMANMLTMASDNSQEFYTLGITEGWHTFYAVLVDNHHMPFMVMNPDGTMGMAPGTVASTTVYVDE